MIYGTKAIPGLGKRFIKLPPKCMMPQVFIALGSNLSDRLKSLERAQDLIRKISKIFGFRVSPVYETDPVGGPKQRKYLNAVVEFETDLSPQELLTKLLEIETQLGRKRSVKNAPRTIDLDLLFYGDQIIHEPGLTVPHPRLHERWFVLKPLSDLAPEWVHPTMKKTVKELLAGCKK